MYAKLAVQPVTPVSQNKTNVERGAIVDRTGFPLAVQTNFYHVGLSVKNIRDNEKLKNRFAEDVAPLLEMLPDQQQQQQRAPIRGPQPGETPAIPKGSYFDTYA